MFFAIFSCHAEVLAFILSTINHPGIKGATLNNCIAPNVNDKLEVLAESLASCKTIV